jgi:dienelactone hydrolase
MQPRPLVLSIAVLVAALAGPVLTEPAAQSRPTLGAADYDQFETIGPAAPRGGLSPDGRWLAYSITRVGGQNELRVIATTAQTGGAPPKSVPFGTGAVFAATSQWVGYSIGVSEAETERLTQARQPVRRKFGLFELATATETTVDGIESFAFDGTGQSVAMKRYGAAPAPGASGAGAAPAPSAPPAGRGGAAPPPAPALGTTLLVRQLSTGATVTFGNVTEYAWQPGPRGRLLAMIIGAEGQAGNGLHLFDAASSVVRVLDSAAADYAGLAWRDDSADLVVLKSKSDETRDGPTQLVLAWTGLGTAAERPWVLDHTATNLLAESQRLVTFRRPSWINGAAARGAGVMLGVADWPRKPAAPADSGRGRGAGGAASDRPDVDVWHWTDARVNPVQKLALAADRRRNLPAVWHVASGALTVIGQSHDESVAPIRNQPTALVSVFTPYLMDRSIGRGAADWYLADLSTGARRLLRANVRGTLSASTSGRYALFAEGGHYWTINLATNAVANITAGLKTSFVDAESDSTSPVPAMTGSGGWTKDDEFVVLYDKLDVWKVSPSGAGGVRLTNGAPDGIRHRLVTVGGQPGDPVDLSTTYVSLFGVRTKKSGYGRLAADGSASRLVWLDKSVSGLAKAEQADVFVYSAMAADDSPDLFLAGADLSGRPATASNAFLSTYAWTRAELVDYVVTRGKQKLALQGVLHYPANYEPGRKYPMVVYLYERLSDSLHRFQNPSERDYYNGAALTQNGYFFFQPDIVFAPREPGVSVVECVSAALAKVIAMGAVDAARIGVMGHSWGGFDAMYLATHSKLFAAAVSGAGISNLVSNYGNHHWSSGIAETDHIETGQQRMVVPLYDDLPAYIRNSAVFGASTMTTPLLLMTGDNDGTVYWHQSVELYNIARRAKRNVVMLVYNGEDHGLRVRKNQVDYHRRIRAWFDHYLKGASPEKWITDGVPAIAR